LGFEPNVNYFSAPMIAPIAAPVPTYRGSPPRMSRHVHSPASEGSYVADPDGFEIQISGIARPGDSQYKA
jgi:hypothetical protein